MVINSLPNQNMNEWTNMFVHRKRFSSTIYSLIWQNLEKKQQPSLQWPVTCHHRTTKGLFQRYSSNQAMSEQLNYLLGASWDKETVARIFTNNVSYHGRVIFTWWCFVVNIAFSTFAVLWSLVSRFYFLALPGFSPTLYLGITANSDLVKFWKRMPYF